MAASIETTTLLLARRIEVSAAIVCRFVGIGAVELSDRYLGSLSTTPRHRGWLVPKEESRLKLGRSLELEPGADSLKATVIPDWNDVGLLAAIAVLRTALSYFLELELRNAEQRRETVRHSVHQLSPAAPFGIRQAPGRQAPPAGWSAVQLFRQRGPYRFQRMSTPVKQL